MDSIHFIQKQIKLDTHKVKSALKLFDEGSTIPFIARYRKEATGSLNEVELGQIQDQYEKWQQFSKRLSSILENLKERDKLNPELEQKLKKAVNLTELEDLYLPYKQKRKTKATVAKEKGLEPLAKLIYDQTSQKIDLSIYINKEKGVENEEEAIEGAVHIMAEWISELPELRKALRKLFIERSPFCSKVVAKKKEDAVKFKDYFDYIEPLPRVPSHRFLAIVRGNNEGFLKITARPEEKDAIKVINSQLLTKHGEGRIYLERAIADSYNRLLRPSLENETMTFYKHKADEEAIQVFSKNLNELLMAAPLGGKPILAIDPGFRTGCKCVCLNAEGDFLKYFTIYPFKSDKEKLDAQAIIEVKIKEYDIKHVAYGNGTAARETEQFLKECKLNIPLISVNENGASIYSASEIARDEFPDLDITVRGAISIGRRLQDPLAELVKIDPKSIGVGQYQHDVDQPMLKKNLDDVVMKSVNQVGVELNTASLSLLTYVSGLGPGLAKSIVEYRQKNGAFKNRKDLLAVPRLGSKAFEQAAGFLRINASDNPLDKTAVHPESYRVVSKMAKDLSSNIEGVIQSHELQTKIKLENYVDDKFGLPTLKDIIEELRKPGRDPRPQFEVFEFSDKVHGIDDLEEGMLLPGIVSNITKFGAFVDIGVHQDGLVHISEIANRFVKDPMDELQLQQKVRVKVLDIDMKRKRIALSIKQAMDV